jgi:hypothetical protein
MSDQSWFSSRMTKTFVGFHPVAPPAAAVVVTAELVVAPVVAVVADDVLLLVALELVVEAEVLDEAPVVDAAEEVVATLDDVSLLDAEWVVGVPLELEAVEAEVTPAVVDEVSAAAFVAPPAPVVEPVDDVPALPLHPTMIVPTTAIALLGNFIRTAARTLAHRSEVRTRAPALPGLRRPRDGYDDDDVAVGPDLFGQARDLLVAVFRSPLKKDIDGPGVAGLAMTNVIDAEWKRQLQELFFGQPACFDSPDPLRSARTARTIRSRAQ